MEMEGWHRRESPARHRLRTTFDQAASLYRDVRPGYPEALFDDLVAHSGIPPGGRILEVGCGTGQATVPLARRGFSILAIELGEQLAAVAREEVAPYPGVEVLVGTFEDWPLQPEAFDLVTAGTSFHWIDQELRYAKAAAALRPGGAVAPFWNLHVHTDRDQGFFEAVQAVYEREVPWLVPQDYRGLLRPEDVPLDEVARIAASGRFGPVTVRRYPWEAEYDTATYLRLLQTYSGHRTLEPAARARLLDAIAELMESRYGGRIVKGYLTTLYVARRR